MGKKSNIIEINGKKYDAHSGAPIGHAISHSAPHKVTAAKPITVHHHSDTPRSTPITPPHKTDKTVRQAAKKLARHTPQHSTTLMRQVVRKPPASLKRRVKAQGHTGSLVEQPATPVVPKLSFGNLDDRRVRRANHIKKSRLITHFVIGQPDYAVPVTVVRTSQPALTLKAPKRQPAPDASDIFDRAIQQATSHLQPTPQKPRKHRLHLGRKHAKA